jgi:hypothetical protein
MAQSSLIPEVHLARLRELNGIAAGEKIEHNQALNFRTIRSDQRGQQQKAPAPPSAPAMQQAHTRQPSPRSDLPQIVPKTAAPEPSASTHAFPVTPAPTAKNSAGKGSQKEQSVESSYSYDSYSSSSSE